ncbi:DUF2188 domain-containing protein [Jannaschia sp. CCS1]|uniref:DUF2188 domain-containing protein n=1 Tax=Jannaschia sp. (strain CCS1) TaxID=290400 RepID=UPI000053D159|nr:DUF2188 domain-containing protein [Jannaschia sp. CCS1]ABD55388.1 hypothetical protein Jann_2471 [Jannaschia sp. CCS1]
MTDKKDFWTQQRDDGQWEVKREGNEKASSVHPTQAKTWDQAKDRARSTEGEAYLKGRDGKIRERNTCGNDPKSSKG